MAITKVRKNYHQARWDEPMIFELSTPGVRGIIPPAPEAEIVAAVGDVAGGLPESIRRSAAPALPEVDQKHVLAHYLHLSQETLGSNLHADMSQGTCTMKYNPRVNEDLAADPRFADVHPWQDDDTMQGILRDLLRVRADHEGGLGDGPLHAAAGRRRSRRVHRRLHDPRLPPRPRRGGAAQRGHHDHVLAPVRRGLAGHGGIQDRDPHAQGRRLPGPRRAQGRRRPPHSRHPHHQPRGHGHLQSAHRGVRQGRPRGRRHLLQRPGQRQRADGYRPDARRRLRLLPLQPPQDLRRPARRLRPGHRRHGLP